MKRSLAVVLALCVPAVASAMPTDDEFVQIRANRTSRLTNCAVQGIDGAVVLRFTLEGKAPVVELPAAEKKQPRKIGPKGYKFAACGLSDQDGTSTVLFLKKNKSDTTALERSLDVEDFEDQGRLGSACRSVKGWPGTFIYKTIGSGHFPSSDPRRYTISLILRHGAGVGRTSCATFLARNGREVAKVGLYEAGGEYYARYYGGTGCGTRISGRSLAAKARQIAGDDDIYAKFGNTCYGPIPAGSCRNSSDPQC